MKKRFKSVSFLQAVLILSGVIALFALYETWGYMRAERYMLWHSNRSFLLLAYLLNSFGIYALIVWNPDAQVARIADKFTATKRWKFFSGFLFLVAVLLPVLVTALDKTHFFLPGYSLVWLAWWLAIIASVFLSLSFGLRLEAFFAITLLSMAFVARLEIWSTFISTYPFSLGWSEASRYYYASLFYSERIYGESFAWTFLHPTRYLLQSVPFLFGQVPLWVHRAWQVFLWFSLTLGTGFAFAWRLSRRKKNLLIPLALWFFIFMLQGAVYYHLQVAVLIVLLGTKRNDFKRTCVALFFASLWAGISRVNWIPVPAMLTIFLFLLEEPVSTYKNLWDYLKKPIVWTFLGIGTAFASQSIYVFISGNSDNIASFGSSFTSSLLWYRLLPNATYKPGIFLSTLLISFPSFGLLFTWLRGKRQPLHWIRHLGLWAILLVLLVGGLVVSTKIGGGADLHNMDAFIVILGVWAGYVFVAGINGEKPEAGHPVWRAAPVWVAFAILIPFWLSMTAMKPIPEYDLDRGLRNLDTIQEYVADVKQNDGEVLFISQRHLLSLGMVEGVTLDPDYEVVELMEMAMSDNTLYLDNFYDDLYSQRFALIVASPQFVNLKENGEAFAEENNAWALKVSEPLLCAYRPIETMKRSGIVLFVPRNEIKAGCEPR